MASPLAGDARLAALRRWILEDLGFAGSGIVPASADASFRRYFRVTPGSHSTGGARTFIVMDAPPDKESLAPFVRVAAMLAGIGLNVPRVLARNDREGLLLLTDLGTRQYLTDLAEDRDVERLYADALKALVRMQTAGRACAPALPAYDRALLSGEMELLPEWFLRRHLGIDVGAAERTLLDGVFATLADAALAQPATLVHRDYHSRNLMVTADDNPGILDFQDAVHGPVTYDLVSLLKDCYIAWPAPRVRAWALQHRRRLLDAGNDAGADDAEFLRWFELMGLQRHIKVLGIFCRLFYRDRKSQYLRDLPRVLGYVQAAAAALPETAALAQFIRTRVEPRFAPAQSRALA